MTWKAVSEAFGKTILEPTNKITMNLRFPGQYYDQETGTHYNYFRDYNPSLGRYNESDPIGLFGGINSFVYVKENPINWVDSYGLNRYKGGGKSRPPQGERGQQGKNPVPGKKCVPWPGKPGKMKCKDNQTGKWDKSPRPIPPKWKEEDGKIVPDPSCNQEKVGDNQPNRSTYRPTHEDIMNDKNVRSRKGDSYTDPFVDYNLEQSSNNGSLPIFIPPLPLPLPIF